MFGELCRLCERPAADGGHRAAELDKDKLAEWCLNFLGTTLAKEIDDRDLFCYFCVWDARTCFAGFIIIKATMKQMGKMIMICAGGQNKTLTKMLRTCIKTTQMENCSSVGFLWKNCQVKKKQVPTLEERLNQGQFQVELTRD
ncbi:uncharacterized protein LOC132198317 isoform X4 [Neocloeon triangulifer]|uniref:uncharacterized protein LOC132198317 isoform X4 n=1 Tax=Neocloeon triangulifer TaxID=2078957 RepID=UPI00286ED273|nr:uncharacterized protein LOC132198317 isoform X4 [Neocloeon triangulifer]